MIAQALIFLADTVLGLFSTVFLVRFYLQVARAPARNPISQFVTALTDPVVRPARRLIPGWAGLDLSTLVLAWLSEFILLVLVRLIEIALMGDVSLPLAVFAALAVVSVLRISIYILMGAVIIQAILSWVAPLSPIAPVLVSVVRPFIRPIQKHVPPVGNVDLSPLILLIVLQLILMLPLMWLANAVRALLTMG